MTMQIGIHRISDSTMIVPTILALMNITTPVHRHSVMIMSASNINTQCDS